jgi:hypothetical protein
MLEQQRDRNSWEKFRLLATTLISPYTTKGKGLKPHKLWPFEWDKKDNKSPKMTKERLRYLQERSKKLKRNG